MTMWTAVVVYMLLTFAAWAWVCWMVKRDTERMVKDFESRFPGRCAICSYHRYGLQEGHASGRVAEHRCSERREEKP